MLTTNIATTTTYFVGAYYEVANGIVTKYYYAGSQRIAMRSGGTLFFMFGDHLGSTSLVTFGNGNVVSETRYEAWGEERYSDGTNPTKYTYTGQYSYTADFGLMFYNARWVDVSLGRFVQADSIIPPGVQGSDRYAYSNNNPVKYTDPSGHCATSGDDWCHHTDLEAVTKIATGPCASKPSCNRTRETFTLAGINHQRDHGYAGRTASFFDWLNGTDEYDSVGPGQLTRWELDHSYGEEADRKKTDGHEQVGLGLSNMNPYNDDVAKLGLMTKLTLRLDVCSENDCTTNDMVIVAAFSIDEKIYPSTLKLAFSGAFKSKDSNFSVDWVKFIDKQLGHLDRNLTLIDYYASEVRELQKDGSYVPNDVNWDAINNLK